MRILILGAGAVGGYFGARLLEAGRDVTFLVRPARAALLARNGLIVRSPIGDLDIPNPPTIVADAIREAYDVVLLSCKAYDLESAIESIGAAVGPETSIVPLLNGIRQLDALDERFGAGRVLGGFCAISSAVDPEGRIDHFNRMQTLVFGAREPTQETAVAAIEPAVTGAGFDGRLSDSILLEMWEKWLFIAAAAGVTCLMRAAIGDIVRAAGPELPMTMLEETAFIAAANGFAPRSDFYQRTTGLLTDPDSPLMASMLRDVEAGSRTEADHIIGDLIRRGPSGDRSSPMLRFALAHLRAYEARRARGEAAVS